MLGTLRYLAAEGGIAWHGLQVRKSWLKTEQNQRQQIERIQADKLNGVFSAARRAPYWRFLPADQTIRASGASTRQHLSGLPILTKAIVREQGTKMLTDSVAGNVEWCVTGGTTGEPLRVARDIATRAAVMSACIRGFGWHGVEPGDATVQVRGFDRISFLGGLRCRAGNFRLIDPVSTAKNRGKSAPRAIRKFKPHCLVGYPTSLLKLAELAEGENVSVPVIFSTGEMLHPIQREKLETIFTARVAEYYGSNEVGGIAFECERGNLHVTEEHVLLETVDEQGESVWDRPGRILVTDLDNRIMPLLRYEIGDLGVLTREPCACGRSLLVLRELQGRRQDALRNARGDILPAMFFAEQSRHLRGIRSYQLVQRQMDEILFRYVAAGPTAETEVEKIHRDITHQLGPQMRVTREVCTEIPLTPRGKTRLVVGLS